MAKPGKEKTVNHKKKNNNNQVNQRINHIKRGKLESKLQETD